MKFHLLYSLHFLSSVDGHFESGAGALTLDFRVRRLYYVTTCDFDMYAGLSTELGIENTKQLTKNILKIIVLLPEIFLN